MNTPAFPPLPLSVTDRIREAYAAWNIPHTLFPRTEMTEPAALRDILSAASASTPPMPVRWYPSDFDPASKGLRGFPRPYHPQWHSLERALRTLNTKTATVRLPHFWQLEPAAHDACRAVGAPLFVGEPENVPVGAAAVISLHIDTVIAEAEEAETFSSYLQSRKVALPHAWVVIHRADAPKWSLPSAMAQAPGIALFQEVHLMPGVPLLVQCPLLAERKEPLFHVSDAYLWESMNARDCVTSLDADPLPLMRLQLPFKLQKTDSCPCGQPVVSR